jgi:hypothetical protein
MKNLTSCIPRKQVLDGTADFVVNLSMLQSISKEEAEEFLDSNVLTSGMDTLIRQTLERVTGGKAIGIYKLSESMGGGKTQTMIVAGIIGRYPELIKKVYPNEAFPSKEIQIIPFSGRATDKFIWVEIGKQLGVEFSPDRPPSEEEWVSALKNKVLLILLDEIPFYLVNLTSIGSMEEGGRLARRASIAMTNLFGAIRDYPDCRHVCVMVADLEKDWEQGGDELARVLQSHVTLSGDMKSLDHELSKGAVTIAPVDNTSDELYSILRKRLFECINFSEAEIDEIAKAYMKEAEIARQILGQSPTSIHQEVKTSFPFHFSTKRLIETFNDNPRFQKTRDVIRLMSTIVRDIFTNDKMDKTLLLSLASADLNNPDVSSRFREIKPSLAGAMQTDVAQSGIAFAERLDQETNGQASMVARWIYAASLSEVRPRGLTVNEIAEYMLEPNRDLSGLTETADTLYKTCWYIEKYRDDRLFFNKHKNLNAQVQSYMEICAIPDRNNEIEKMLIKMFEPKERRCYQKAFVIPDLGQVNIDRDTIALIVCKPDTDFNTFFQDERFKNRIMFLTAIDRTAMFNVNKRGEKLWAIKQVFGDLTPEDAQYEKAKETVTEYESELFLAIRALFSELYYPTFDGSDSILEHQPLSDTYTDNQTGNSVKYESKNATKGELVIQSTLQSVYKFQNLDLSSHDKLKALQPLRHRVEEFLFPSSGKTTWDNILEAAAINAALFWTEPGILNRMQETLFQAGAWRKIGEQIQKPPFEEEVVVAVEYERDKQSGKIFVTDFQLQHGDTLLVKEDKGEWRQISIENPFESEAMEIIFLGRDSTGQNKESLPFRITNYIDLKSDFSQSTSEGYKVMKIGVVPPDCKVFYTTDGSDPANNGIMCDPVKGIEAKQSSTVKIFAEKGAINYTEGILVPTDEDADDEIKIDPDKPAQVKAQNLPKLVTRSETYNFISGLPENVQLDGTRAKVSSPDGEQFVQLYWHRNMKLSPADLLEAFSFLDKQIENGEWSLEMMGRLYFSEGKTLIDWQNKNNLKFSPGVVTQ